MDRQYSWKKTEDIEIDMADLLCSFCMRWKQIIVCALAAALMMGVYSYWKNKDEVFPEVSDMENLETKLSDEERQGIEDVLYLAKEIEDAEEYMENSILMQTDPYRKNQAVLLYSIECDNRQRLQKMAESYISFLADGGMNKAVRKADKEFQSMHSVYLSELVTAWQLTDSSNSIVMDSAEEKEAEKLFYVEVTGRDSKMVRQLSKDVQKALENYVSNVKKFCGNHSLALLNCTYSEEIDSSLQARQHEKREALKVSRVNLKAAEDALSQKQRAVYVKESGIETDDTQPETESGAEVSSGPGISLKYVLAGICGGIFLYAFVFTFCYLLRGEVRSADEFRAVYTIPLLGSISGGLSVRQRNIEDGDAVEQMLGHIRIVCRKHQIGTLCLAAEFEPDKREKDLLECVSKELQECGICASILEKITSSVSGWDVLSDTDGVLLICKAGVTAHKKIDQVMELCMENEADVIGAVLLDTV